MQTGFRFKGKHTREMFGAYDGEGNIIPPYLPLGVRTQSRPLVPEMKAQDYDVPFRDGEYDFSRANIYGREFYKSRVFKIDIKVMGRDYSELQKRLIELSRWLYGSGELVFDDTVNVKWAARVVDMIDYRPEHGKSAVLSVSFAVEPFGMGMFDTTDGACLDDEILLNSDMPLDISEYFTFTGTSGIIYNIGDVPVRPVISISPAESGLGNEHTLSVTVNGQRLSITYEKSYINDRGFYIDCENQVVLNPSGGSEMANVSGNFFELLPGGNAITLSQSRNVTVKYVPLYLYGTEFEEVKLSE